MTPPRLAAGLQAGLPRTYLRPCLLLLIAEGTSHGYELLDRANELGLERIDPGGLYRCLRAMDEEGLVHSTWEPSASGPARRNYELTDAGRAALDSYAAIMTRVAESLASYRDRYRGVQRSQPPAVR